MEREIKVKYMSTTSQAGIDLIKHFEGFSAEPYMDANDGWTVGYGHLFKEGETPHSVTHEEAEALLRGDLAIAEEAVKTLAPWRMTPGQFDALVSFTYNVGAKAFAESTLRRFLGEGRLVDAAAEFIRWRFDDGKAVKGLLLRRLAEAALFLS